MTSENDAATVALGSLCRIPSAEDFNELFDNSDNIWTTLNGILGRLFTSRINGQVLFIPAAGFFGGTSNSSVGKQAHCWSSTYISQANSTNLYFSRTEVNTNASGSRRHGYNIRPVMGLNPNRSVIPPTPEDEPKDEETTTTEEPKDKDER